MNELIETYHYKLREINNKLGKLIRKQIFFIITRSSMASTS